MELKIKINSNIYSLPLTNGPVSTESIAAFDQDLQFAESVISKDTPGTLTINNVTYSAYQAQDLKSLVPNSSGTAYSRTDDSGITTEETQVYSTSPVQFSAAEMSSLVDILKTLATYSHTHSKTDDGITETTTTYDGQEYYCTNHNNNRNHVNKGDNCNNYGLW